MQMVWQQDEDRIDAGSEQGVEVREMPGRVTQSALRIAKFISVTRENAGDGERRILPVQRGNVGVVEKLPRADESAVQLVRRGRGFFAKPVPLRFQFGNRLTKRGWQGMFDSNFLP